jgi:hypothetical protein
MSHKHEVMIEKIYAHPISTNLDWTKIQHALEHYGAQIEISASNRAKIVLNGAEFVMSLPHHGHEISDKTEITQLRHFLESVGVKPHAH